MTTPSDNPSDNPTRPAAVPPGPAGVPALPARTQGAGAAAVPTVVVATYPDYAAAQQAVDYLSDNKFPVEQTAIVGTDLRLVENVLGRLTTGRAASPARPAAPGSACSSACSSASSATRAGSASS